MSSENLKDLTVCHIYLERIKPPPPSHTFLFRLPLKLRRCPSTFSKAAYFIYQAYHIVQSMVQYPTKTSDLLHRTIMTKLGQKRMGLSGTAEGYFRWGGLVERPYMDDVRIVERLHLCFTLQHII